MDYEGVIVPGARCSRCDHHKEVYEIPLSQNLVRCGLYGAMNDDDQAEHCINYYVPRSARMSGEPESKG